MCDALGGKREVSKGWFNLFVDASGERPRKLMKYRLLFEDGERHPVTLSGFKEVEDDPGFDLWSDTTTLFTRILAGHVEPGEGDDDAELVAGGILHVLPQDFAVQLTTFRVHPAHRADALARFSALFAGDLWEVFGPGGKKGA